MRREEVEGVLAHEVAHIQNGDMVTMTLIQGVVNAFVMFFARVIANIVRKRWTSAIASGQFFVTTIVLDIVLGILGMMVVAGSRAPASSAPTPARRRSRPRQHDRRAAAPAGDQALVDNRSRELATMKINGGGGAGCFPPTRRSTLNGARESGRTFGMGRWSRRSPAARGAHPRASLVEPSSGAGVPSETVEAEGHLIDSGNFQAILTTIVEHGASYEIQRFDVGRTNETTSRPSRCADTRVAAASARQAVGLRLLRQGRAGRAAATGRHGRRGAGGLLLHDQSPHRGVRPERRVGAGRRPAHGRRDRRRRRLRDQSAASCATSARAIIVVCGMQGVRVLPDVQSRDKPTFGFMSNEVSSERRVETAVARVADMMRRVKRRRDASRSSPGPSWCTPAAGYFCELIASATWTCCSRATRWPCTTSSSRCRARRSASISTPAIPSSTAIAITCARSTRFGAPAASAGGRDRRAEIGHHARVPHARRALHPRRIDSRRWPAARDDDGSGRGAGRLRRGARRRRDGGHAVVDAAQHRRRQHAAVVGEGVCVDINPAVVTKLSDRGSTQTIGIVTDVGLFLHQLS